MEHHYLDLEFETEGTVSPVARVYIKTSGTINGKHFHYLGQDCASASELDGVINRIVSEAENMRGLGHKLFESERRRSPR